MNRLPFTTASGRMVPFLALAFLLLAKPHAYGHVAKGPMPDSVAEMEYRILLEFKPQNTEVRTKLAMILYRSNKLGEAVAEFTKVLQDVPDDFDALDGLGLALTGQEKFDQALVCFRKAMASNPDDGLIHYHLGQALEKKGDYPGAANAYRTALQKNGWSGNNDAGHAGRETIENALKALDGKLKKNSGE